MAKMVKDISSTYKEKVWGKDEGGEQITDGYVFRGKELSNKQEKV